MERISLQIMLSDLRYSSLKRLGAFCRAEEREERALRRNTLIVYKKLFLEAHKSQLDEFLSS
jgi:hypothetical protein